ncbi:uncharacterized protein ASCRUDRAFT_73189 [Ascoidea rubescens DSM 1968]|uniref:Uncharacterized protein n=1 Tax=Ascoidea rubescens DSM 1968 TaxID=1344418 RepID=A0A1D2VP15_9ASCO|nr:hypothetical protein ASCRUDRAFT_73189 [Ascoidea rubescens DSM 1968]ODV63295.1 hypothetical protein ASCRUDRAFT_73189 [Ascoidea rubescens DSM 1968]
MVLGEAAYGLASYVRFGDRGPGRGGYQRYVTDISETYHTSARDVRDASQLSQRKQRNIAGISGPLAVIHRYSAVLTHTHCWAIMLLLEKKKASKLKEQPIRVEMLNAKF